MNPFLIALIVSILGVVPLASAKVEFKEQTISDSLPQSKAEQKLIFYVCSSVQCSYCTWMDKHVYSDKDLSAKINDQLISIKPSAKQNRMEFYSNCKSLPSMLFFDENGKLIHKFEGKRNLTQMNDIVNDVLSTNCTGLDEKLNEELGTRKASVCCRGLVKNSKEDGNYCVKQACVEAADKNISFPGLPSEALPCCDDSAKRLIHPKMGGGNAHRFGKEFQPEFRVECVDQNASKEINQTGRFTRPQRTNSQKKNPNKIQKSSGNQI